MRKIILLLGTLFLIAVGFFAIFNDHFHEKESLIDTMLEQLSNDRTVLSLPYFEVDDTGKIIETYMYDGQFNRLAGYISNADRVQKVDKLPNIAEPVFHYGENVIGNNEKIYYVSPNGMQIIEITVRKSDQIDFLLYITQGGMPYPEVRTAFAEAFVKHLKKEANLSPYEQADEFLEGEYEIRIKTLETLNRVISYVKNCVSITDITEVLIPDSDGPSVVLNGERIGNYHFCEYRDSKTGHVIMFIFNEDDTKEFYDYIQEGLQHSS